MMNTETKKRYWGTAETERRKDATDARIEIFFTPKVRGTARFVAKEETKK